MELVWNISRSDIERLRSFVAAAKSDALVRSRIARNLSTKKAQIAKPAFWHALVGSLVTTQQKSGPESAVARFLRERPFPLSYAACCSRKKVEPFVTGTLSAFGGIRRSNRIGSELATNLLRLEKGLWRELLLRVNSLIPEASRESEAGVAEYLDEQLVGLGPKQSRNLLQGLGATRYEIPIDSRVTKWLNNFGFPIHLSSVALADRNYYGFVSDGIQQLCAAAGVFPCVFDAAVFASFDRGNWRPENTTAWWWDGA